MLDNKDRVIRLKRVKRWTLIGWVGLLLAAMLLAGCEEEDVAGVLGGGNVSASETETVILDASAIVSLDVQSSNGAIRVRGQAGTQTASVVITKRSRGETLEEAQDRLERIQVECAINGTSLAAIYGASDQDADVKRWSGVDFDIVVPPGTHVSADTSNGAVEIDSIRGTITLDTSNGAIDVSHCVGDLYADTSNGRIEVYGFDGDIRADTSNGEIWIEEVTGLIDAETSNGSVHYVGRPAVDATHRLRTSNGSITARIPADASIHFEAHTSTGTVRSSLPLVGDTQGDDWSADLNPPAGTIMDLRTSNGSIRIEAAP